MADVYYLVSDLHIGGDEQLRTVDFLEEFLAFLRDLETTDEDAELLINGDAFGLWEFTGVEGPAKFDELLAQYPELFEQLRATGETVPITLIPGNHDYELAAYDEYVDRLAEYNVRLRQVESITRTVGDFTVYVEHGMQRDPSNRIPDFGNPFANPPGYFVNQHVTSRAGQLSARGKYNWLKDIQAVTPMTMIPEWLISNYFYREMSPFLRYAAVPFLLLFNVGLAYVAIFVLDYVGIWSLPMNVVQDVLADFGPVGRLLDVFLTANLVVLGLLVAVSVPLYVLFRDVRSTLRRFGLLSPGGRAQPSRDPYLEGARDVFEDDSSVAAFVYGHTHRASLTTIGNRVVCNTGTWLKRLRRVGSVIGVLPPVFYASYRLNYFRFSSTDDGAVVVEYESVQKPDPDDETLLERLVTRSPAPPEPIPDRTVVDPANDRLTSSADEVAASDDQPTRPTD
ncbi:metallophosphoesterase [Salinarchaeum sp. Harcht-Bsk1]|uniref:metallophosphoesterase n=1 Tax=Salinarchaeum sp. Harcht-Bsk1 TaxID=1333523 RepID=UPI00034230E7|nr:metallophosphoesterase [Salinarchaeum sp. Harcht-Bsk1]AGN00064.1 metallophosphoesterase [Salinarchaeum sp. Harcht-Bsk1]